MSFLPRLLAAPLAGTCLAAALAAAPLPPGTPDYAGPPAVPGWAQDAIWYQIFPERFANGDPSNDPTRDTLEWPIGAGPGWHITPWTQQWYARAAWEKAMGPKFFDHGVFDRRYGGDLQGVIDRLDYLQDLGINALYFNPVFFARSLHKYDASSMHHIDPNFGPDPQGDLALIARETADPRTWQWTAADRLFLRLLQEAKRRGIRVIIDGVFNHTGRDFFAFQNLNLLQEKSPYRDWYVVHTFRTGQTARNDFDYEGWWGFRTLPVFAHTADDRNLHPGPKEYVWNITRRWMDPNGDGDPSDGIDGWRLDVAEELPIAFWQEWNAYVRQINPQAITVAEIWSDSAEYLRKGGFSAAMNYHGFAFPVKAFLIDDAITAREFLRQLDQRRRAQTREVALAQQNLLDSHDTDRLASKVVNGFTRAQAGRPRLEFDRDNSPRHSPEFLLRKPNAEERKVQRMVALAQATWVGAPMTYYGTEAGMWGADDPCDRAPMVWPGLKYEPQTLGPAGPDGRNDDVTFDHEFHAYTRSLHQLRAGSAALRRGDAVIVHGDDEARVAAYARVHEREVKLVVFNRHTKARTVEFFLPFELDRKADQFRPVLASSGRPADVKLRGEGLRLQIELPPLTAFVLASE